MDSRDCGRRGDVALWSRKILVFCNIFVIITYLKIHYPQVKSMAYHYFLDIMECV